MTGAYPRSTSRVLPKYPRLESRNLWIRLTSRRRGTSVYIEQVFQEIESAVLARQRLPVRSARN